MRFRFPLIFLLLLSLSCSHRGDSDELLAQLNEALAHKDTYEAYFQQRMQSLKQIQGGIESPEHEYNINKRLAEEYSAYSLDSTVRYLTRNMEIAHSLGDRLKDVETSILLAETYIKSGYQNEASDIVKRLDATAIPSELRLRYLKLRHTYEGELMAYSQNAVIFDEKYWRREAYRDSLLRLTPEYTYDWYDLKREEADAAHNYSLEQEYIRQLMAMVNENSRQWAELCFYYAISSEDEDFRLEWLIRSAIADVLCSTRDYASLQMVARMIFKRGDINHSFKYVADHCLPDAIAFNGKLRPWQIACFFPEIESAYVDKSIKQKRMMSKMILVISALLLLIIFSVIVLLVRQRILMRTRQKLEESYLEIERRNADLENTNARLKELNLKMQESDKVKQEYIASFLSILSENISETRRYKNHVLKYIRRGNEKYLVDEIESMPPIDDDIARFYKMFDTTFLNLYPDFVNQFNALLTEDDAIVPKGDDQLSPELRIFALIKLGISDPGKIASLLHYSPNTVYNYRAKIKNKARSNRDDFEDAVRAIV